MPQQTLPSGSPAATSPAANTLVSAREWASGIRLSWFMIIMFLLVLIGVWTLVPTIGTFLDQRAKIAAVDAQIDLTNERIAELERERDRWEDPAFIATQARERLYYVAPGETVYLIDNDLDMAAVGLDPERISANVVEAHKDWAATFLRSLTEAGASRAVTTIE